MLLLGILNVPAGAGVNNTTTSSPFAIPPAVRKLRLISTSQDLAALVVETSCDAASPSAFATTAARGLPVGAAPVDVPLHRFGNAAVLAAWNDGLAAQSIEVWAAEAS